MHPEFVIINPNGLHLIENICNDDPIIETYTKFLPDGTIEELSFVAYDNHNDNCYEPKINEIIN